MPLHLAAQGRRRLLAAAIALCALATPLAAQETATDAPALSIAGFTAEVGDRALVTARRLKKRPTTELPGLEITSITTYEVEVLEKLSEGYVFRWTPVDTTIEGAPPEMTKRLMETLGDQVTAFDYESDARGAPIRIRDREAVEERLFQVIGEIAGDAPKEPFEQMRGMMRAMDDATFASVLAKDATLLAFAQDAEPREAGKASYEEPRGNPLGGAPIPSTVRVEISESEHDDLAQFAWTVDFDTGPLQDSLKAAAVRMAERAGKTGEEVDRVLDEVDLTFKEKADAFLGLDDGWARAVRFERVMIVEMPGQTSDRSERIEIALTRSDD